MKFLICIAHQVGKVISYVHDSLTLPLSIPGTVRTLPWHQWSWGNRCSPALYFLSPISSCLPLAKPNQKPEAGKPWSYGPHRSASWGSRQVEKGRKWIWGDKQKKPVTQSLGNWAPAVRWTGKVRSKNTRPAFYLQGQDLKWQKFTKYRKGVAVLLGRHKQNNCPL